MYFHGGTTVSSSSTFSQMQIVYRISRLNGRWYYGVRTNVWSRMKHTLVSAISAADLDDE